MQPDDQCITSRSLESMSYDFQAPTSVYSDSVISATPHDFVCFYDMPCSGIILLISHDCVILNYIIMGLFVKTFLWTLGNKME